MDKTGKARISVGLILFLAAWSFLSYLSVRDNAIGLLSDSYIYLLLSDFFSPYRSIDGSFAKYLLANYSYPPGFPIVLGAFGGGSMNLKTNYFLDAGFLAATIAVFYKWLTYQSSVKIVALSLSTVFLLLPATLISNLGIFSEHLFMLVVLVAALLLSTNRPSPTKLYAAAVIIGLATMVRTIGVAALFAFAVSELVQRRNKATPWSRIFLCLLIAIAPSICWSVIKAFNGYEQSYVDSVMYDSYWETVTGVVTQIPINLRAMWHYTGSLLGDGVTFAKYIHAVICIFIAVGWVQRARNCTFDSVYILAYLGIILVWPYPNHMGRFLLVVLPFLLFYAYAGSDYVFRLLVSKPFDSAHSSLVGIVLCLVLLLLATPKSISIVGDIISPPDAVSTALVKTPNWHTTKENDRKRDLTALEKIIESMKAIERLTPAGACISSGEPHYMHYFARRRSIKPPPKTASEEMFEAGLAECPFIFMMSVASHPPSEFPPMYPFYRVKNTMKVLDVAFFDEKSKKGTVRSMLVATGAALDHRLPGADVRP